MKYFNWNLFDHLYYRFSKIFASSSITVPDVLKADAPRDETVFLFDYINNYYNSIAALNLFVYLLLL